MTGKELIIRALQDLPDDATAEDAMEVLYLVHKVEKGLKQVGAGQTVPQDEARKRMERWLK